MREPKWLRDIPTLFRHPADSEKHGVGGVAFALRLAWFGRKWPQGWQHSTKRRPLWTCRVGRWRTAGMLRSVRPVRMEIAHEPLHVPKKRAGVPEQTPP